MNFFDFFLPMAEAAQSDTPTLFPFPFTFHIVFAVIAVVFFVYRFAVQKKPYQLIMAIAIPLSLIIWMSDRKNLFYMTGLMELLLIIAAFVSSIAFKPKTAAEADNNNDVSAENADGEE